MPSEISVSVLVLRFQPTNDVAGRTCTSVVAELVRPATFIIRDFQRVAAITHVSPSSIRCPGFVLSDVPELQHFLFFFPHFLWAHRSGNSSPLRPTRLLLCRFRPQHHWVPSNKADASLRLHAPSLFVVPPKKTGQKEKVKTK